MKFRMPYTIILVLLALLGGFSGAAPADTVAHFDFHSPSGFVPPSPYVTATGSGRFSFPTALVSSLAEGSARTVHKGDLTSFSFTATAAYQGAESTFVFTLPSISSFSEVAAKNGPGFYGEGFSITTTPVTGTNPAFGTATLSGISDSPAALALKLTGGTLVGTKVSGGLALNRNVLLTH